MLRECLILDTGGSRIMMRVLEVAAVTAVIYADNVVGCNRHRNRWSS